MEDVIVEAQSCIPGLAIELAGIDQYVRGK
jgi:hypothetical protein